MIKEHDCVVLTADLPDERLEAGDIGTVVDSACLGRDTLFVHDRYPGGMGYARRCLEQIEQLMTTVAAVIRRRCGCG